MKVNKIVKNISIISDIHLEYRDKIPKFNSKHKNNDTLILAGDIGDPFTQKYKDFFNMCSDRFDMVLYVSGNHEYKNKFNIDKDNTNYRIKSVLSKFSNVFFMNNKVINTSNINIAGCTLWSIKQPELHENDIAWIREQNNIDLMITHYLPTYNLIIPFYKNKYKESLHYYASHSDYLIRDPIKIWICGHSHCIYSCKINNTLLYINTPNNNNTYLYPLIINI